MVIVRVIRVSRHAITLVSTARRGSTGLAEASRLGTIGAVIERRVRNDSAHSRAGRRHGKVAANVGNSTRGIRWKAPTANPDKPRFTRSESQLRNGCQQRHTFEMMRHGKQIECA